MNHQQPSTTASPARKAATALLLTAILLVPVLPMASAADIAGITLVRDTTVTLSSNDYNFTVTNPTEGGDNLVFTFPSGFDASSVGTGTTNLYSDLGSPSVVSASATVLNVTFGSDAIKAGTSTFNVHFKNDKIVHPRLVQDAEVIVSLYNATSNSFLGTAVAVDADITAKSLTADLHPNELDKVNLGAGAETDYYIKVTDGHSHGTTDKVVITFPTGFDLSDASFANGATDGAISSSARTATWLGDAIDKIRVIDVKNPVTAGDATIKVEAQNETGVVIATGTFVEKIIATSIVVKSVGSDTDVTEGSTNKDSITVELKTKPSADVTVALDGKGEVEFGKTSLTFTKTNWDTAQTVTVAAIDDDDVEGTEEIATKFTSSSDDSTYNGLSTTHAVDVHDNDVGIVLRHTDGDTTVNEEDGSAADIYEIVLSTKPSKDVTVTIDVPDDLEIDDTDNKVKFTTSNWRTAVEIEVTSAREDDDEYQKDQEVIIMHTASSDDDDYDGEEAELIVTIEDDEHPALGLTDRQIARANELVDITLTEKTDGILVEWELPTQEDLDKIFESDGEITVQGVQILYSNSPYTIAETYEDSDSEFDEAEFKHLSTDGATKRTKYLVTMFFDEDAGKWSANNVPATNDEGYGGSAMEEPLLPWWAWLLIGIGGVILLVLILLAILAAQNRNMYGKLDWDDEGGKEAAPAKEKKATKAKSAPHDLECPVCDHQFTVKGVKPIKTTCPNCGAKGTLN